MGDVGSGKAIEVVMEVVVLDSLLIIPSSMLTFVSLLDKYIVMFGVSTSSIAELVFETPDGVTFSVSGMIVAFCPPKLMFASILDMFTFTFTS